jgi:hypothetical protein
MPDKMFTSAGTAGKSAPLLTELEAWLRDERARLLRSASVTKPIDCMLKRWDQFTRFIDDGRQDLPHEECYKAAAYFFVDEGAAATVCSGTGLRNRVCVVPEVPRTSLFGLPSPRTCGGSHRWLRDRRPLMLCVLRSVGVA